MDADALAKRILKDLDNIFSKDPFIAEVDVVPLEECVQNKCPVIHVDHQVAIESWCIKHVYQYAYRQLLEWRTKPYKIDSSILLGWTRAVLIINPDVQVAWNIRRDLVCCQSQTIKDELQLSSIVLTRKPKCSEVFAHRRWLLERLMSKSGWSGLPADILDSEVELCQKAASSYSHNYYAWSHRIWAVQNAATPPQKMVQEELERTGSWVQSHISDHSGFQFRQFLFTWWLKHCSMPTYLNSSAHPTPNDSSSKKEQSGNILSSLLNEISLNSELVLFYRGHEALWYHRRFLLNTLSSIVIDDKTKVPKIFSDKELTQRVKRNKLDMCLEIFGLAYEANFMRDCMEKSQNEAAQLRLIERHKEWVQKILPQSLPTYH